MKTVKTNQITEGPLLETFVKYFIPILLGSILQQSYSFVDALIIGNFAGAKALAAIDSPYATIKLLINTFIALSSGSAIVIAQLYGAKDEENVSKTINAIFLFSIFGGIIISAIGIIFAKRFSYIMLIPDDIFQMSVDYLRIYFAGSVFVFVYNMAAGSLRALGDSKRPFYYLIVSSGLNIILDLVFVAKFRMGVKGAALATIISQAFSAALVIYRMRNQFNYFRFDNFHFASSKANLFDSLKLGFPMAMQSILFSVANIYMQRGINSFGSESIAGWSICGKSDFLIWTLSETMGLAVLTFVAQNYGAKKFDRMKQSLKYGLFISVLTVGSISAILYLFIDKIAHLFTDNNRAIHYSINLMRTVAPFYIFYGIGEVYSGAIKGRGQTFMPMIMTLIGTCLFRIIWILINMPKNANLYKIIFGYPLSWIITATLMFILYLNYSKLNKTNTK
ncbi:MAG: MATE family efflux transporter [Tissierellia bacterium]|nr:MATE family efflux transporter [Tissierellia bacterium]